MAQSEAAREPTALLLDFKLTSFVLTITPEHETAPLYTATLKAFRKPNIIFKDAQGTTFGTGYTHTVDINADCTFNDQPIKIEALRRLKTQYTHRSQVLKVDDRPAQLRWTTETNWITDWDFICLDEKSLPVARLAYNIWAWKKIGRIEFPADEEVSEDLRREIVITATTLLYCMISRANKIFSLVGSAIHRKPQLAVESKTAEATAK